MVDMQGRLIGKRFQAEYLPRDAHEETHGCDYLLTNDMDMEPVPGYAAATWDKGYGDFVMKPDLATLRRVPGSTAPRWCCADVLDHTPPRVPHSPRAMLKRQVARLRELGYPRHTAPRSWNSTCSTRATRATAAKRYRDPKTGRLHRGLPHLQTTKEEGVMRAIRRGLQGAGIPVENSKGEWGPGQEEINVRYAEALEMADRHAI